MLSRKHKASLSRLIGPNSIFICHFLSSHFLNGWAKIQLLDMAISTPSKEFLPVLDKVFEAFMSDETRLVVINKRRRGALIIVNGLKLINDFYFNNPMRACDTSTLVHYFGADGPIKYDDFKQAVLNLVNDQKNKISQKVCDKDSGLGKIDNLVELKAKHGDDTWRNGVLRPPEELVIKAMSDPVAMSIFTPAGNYLQLADLLADLKFEETPESSATCSVPRQYNVATFFSIFLSVTAEAGEQEILKQRGPN